MASSKELGAESVTGYDDEDIRGDSKKRKFKPLSAMKRFFTKRRDKKDAVVAVKAKSTTALHSGYRTEDDEDDDDGGFKSHTKPLSLAGNRSLSEDSVFSSEPRVQPVSAFPKSAVSEESLPKSAFQSELLSKLNQRRYQTSDDDRDDGLPRSPVPPVMTTADVILGEPLKKPPGKSDKTSYNRDSDQSLISVDSSENEEEDLGKWRSSVPARKLGQTASPTSGSAMDSFDLNSIQKTELLVSRAAKDRILVKPKRKGTRQSHKKRDSSTPTPPLPSLNEESPTGTKPENVKGNRIPGSPSAVSPVKRTFSDETPPSPSSATSFPPVPASDSKPGPSVSSRSKPALSSIVATSSEEGDRESPQTSPTSKSPQITASVAAVAASPPPPPPKVTTPTSPGAAFPPHKVDGISNTKSQSQLASSHPAIVDIPGKPADVKKFEENLSASDRGDRLNLPLATDISVSRLSQSHRGLNEIRPNSDFRSVMSQFQNPGLASSRNSGVIVNSIDDSPLKVSDPSSTVLDFKARREVRSRTLPAASSEQSVPTVQRSSSHHVPVSGNSSKELLKQPEQQPSSYKNAASTSAAAVTLPSASGTNKPESDKLSSEESSVTPTDELSFVVQKKETCHEVNLENEVTKVSEVVQKSEVSVSESKSTFTSTNRIEKKRGSVETVSYRNKDLYDQTFKKAENSDVKRRSADINNATKLGSIDVSSTQRESIEIEISQLTSVRASRSLFDSASKMASSQKDIHHPPASAIPSAADRIKPFSATASSVKPVSNAGHNHTGGAASSYENAKQVATSGGITHHRGGSVKSSPAKPVEARSTFLTRGGSVKGPAESSQSPEPAATTLPSVAETTPAPKHESSGTSSALPSSAAASQPSSAPHAPTHVTAQPNTSLPSQTPSVTPLSFNVKPIYAYASKPATNTASATRPAAAYIPSGSKPTTATTATATASLASSAVDVKLAMGPTSGKSVAVSNVKPIALASVASNVSTPFVSSVVSMPSLLSSSSSSSVITPVNTTNSSSSSSASRSSTLRSHASFTTPAAFKPHITSSAPHSTRSSPVTKSPSFKAAATSTERPTATEKRATEGKTSTTSATVPAWRTHLSTKEVKIEIIENTPSPQSSSSSSSSQSRSEVLRNSSDKGKLSSSVKKTDALTSAGATVETEKTTRRTSKVLDMVKNFQNLQAPS